MGIKKNKMRLGEILVAQGILDESDIDRALLKQKKDGGLLGEVLFKMGLVKEEDIVIALAKQFNIPYLPVQNCEINQKILSLVPLSVAKKNLYIPIDRINDVLTVIMVDPTNEYAKQDIMDATGMKLQVLVGTATEINTAIKKYYKVKTSLLDINEDS